LTERRQLRRAAEEALMTPAFSLRPLDVAVATPSTAGPFGTRGDADHPDPWGDDRDTNGHEPADAITEPIAVAALHDRLGSAPIGSWNPDLIGRRLFRVVQPWYRTKTATAALTAAALAAVAIVVSSVLLVSRSGEQATGVTSAASTAASPPPSSARPAPSASSTAPAPPPPPPPPPLPSAAPDSPPSVWRSHAGSPSRPSPTKKPEIGVTRAPMSVAPSLPPPPPVNNSATPGDGHKHHWGF
jgi:hypothetical protein